jgi:hypothetical protein
VLASFVQRCTDHLLRCRNRQGAYLAAHFTQNSFPLSIDLCEGFLTLLGGFNFRGSYYLPPLCLGALAGFTDDLAGFRLRFGEDLLRFLLGILAPKRVSQAMMPGTINKPRIGL